MGRGPPGMEYTCWMLAYGSHSSRAKRKKRKNGSAPNQPTHQICHHGRRRGCFHILLWMCNTCCIYSIRRRGWRITPGGKSGGPSTHPTSPLPRSKTRKIDYQSIIGFVLLCLYVLTITFLYNGCTVATIATSCFAQRRGSHFFNRSVLGWIQYISHPFHQNLWIQIIQGWKAKLRMNRGRFVLRVILWMCNMHMYCCVCVCMRE